MTTLRTTVIKTLAARGFRRSVFKRSARIPKWGMWTDGFSIIEGKGGTIEVTYTGQAPQHAPALLGYLNALTRANLSTVFHPDSGVIQVLPKG